MACNVAEVLLPPTPGRQGVPCGLRPHWLLGEIIYTGSEQTHRMDGPGLGPSPRDPWLGSLSESLTHGSLVSSPV